MAENELKEKILQQRRDYQCQYEELNKELHECDKKIGKLKFAIHILEDKEDDIHQKMSHISDSIWLLDIGLRKCNSLEDDVDKIIKELNL